MTVTVGARAGWTCGFRRCREFNSPLDLYCRTCGSRRPDRRRDTLEWIGLAVLGVWVAAWAMLWVGDVTGWWKTEVGSSVLSIAFLVAVGGIPIGLFAAACWVIVTVFRSTLGTGQRPNGLPPTRAAVWRVTVEGAVHRVWVHLPVPGSVWVNEIEMPLDWDRHGGRRLADFAVAGHPAHVRLDYSLIDQGFKPTLEVDGGQVDTVR